MIFHSYVNVYQRVFVLSLSSLLIFAHLCSSLLPQQSFIDFDDFSMISWGIKCSITVSQWANGLIGGPGYHSKSGQQCSSQAAIAWYILDTTESLMLQAQKECSCIDHAHVLVSEDRSGCFSFRCSSPLIENFACCWRFLPANARDRRIAWLAAVHLTRPSQVVLWKARVLPGSAHYPRGRGSGQIAAHGIWWYLVLPRGDRLATNVGSSTWDLLCCKSEAMPCSACKWLDARVQQMILCRWVGATAAEVKTFSPGSQFGCDHMLGINRTQFCFLTWNDLLKIWILYLWRGQIFSDGPIAEDLLWICVGHVRLPYAGGLAQLVFAGLGPQSFQHATMSPKRPWPGLPR